MLAAIGVLFYLSEHNSGLPSAASAASAAWSYIPTTILVVLGYALQSVGWQVYNLATYMALKCNTGSGRRSILFTPHRYSALTLPLYASLRARSLALLGASVVAILYPGIKIVAAGLYSPSLGPHLSQVTIATDSSLVDGLENLYSLPPYSSVGVVERASQFAEWMQIPDFGFPARAGALDSLVFSNITDLNTSEGIVPQPGDLAEVTVAAVKVDVVCSPFDSKHFNLAVQDTGDGKGSLDFTFSCATEACNNALNGSSGLSRASNYAETDFHNRRPFGYYEGLAGFQTDFWDQILDDTRYNVIIANWTSIAGPVANFSYAGDGHQINGSVVASADMFNVSLPTVRAVSCKRGFTQAKVNVAVSQNTKIGTNGVQTTLPWTIVDYKRNSVIVTGEYKSNIPIWMAPPSAQSNHYDMGNTGEGRLYSPTLWPSQGAGPKNFFELIAAYQQYQAGDLTGLLDADQLANASKAMITAYCVQALSELRPYAHNGSQAEPQALIGVLTTQQRRVRQDFAATIALAALLFVVLSTLIVVFVKFPSEPVLPSAPGCIATQMALLSGSRLVKQLREDNVKSVRETMIWGETFGLGWWQDAGARSPDGFRWGVDVGKVPDVDGNSGVGWDRRSLEWLVDLAR